MSRNMVLQNKLYPRTRKSDGETFAFETKMVTQTVRHSRGLEAAPFAKRLMTTLLRLTGSAI